MHLDQQALVSEPQAMPSAPQLPLGLPSVHRLPLAQRLGRPQPQVGLAALPSWGPLVLEQLLRQVHHPPLVVQQHLVSHCSDRTHV